MRLVCHLNARALAAEALADGRASMVCVAGLVMGPSKIGWVLLLGWGLAAGAWGQSNGDAGQTKPGQSLQQAPENTQIKSGIGQALDYDAAVLAKVPVDPLFARDPLHPVLGGLDRELKDLKNNDRLSFAASYTLVDQYATATPEGVRHNWGLGRFDLVGGYKAYSTEGRAGTFSLLVRSGENIGVSQQFNLSDRLGSGLYLNWPAGRRTAGADYGERSVLPAGSVGEAGRALCREDSSERVHQPEFVQQRRADAVFEWGE